MDCSAGATKQRWNIAQQHETFLVSQKNWILRFEKCRYPRKTIYVTRRRAFIDLKIFNKFKFINSISPNAEEVSRSEILFLRL